MVAWLGMLHILTRLSDGQRCAISLVLSVALLAPILLGAALLSGLSGPRSSHLALLPFVQLAGILLLSSTGLTLQRGSDIKLADFGRVVMVGLGLGTSLHGAQWAYFDAADLRFSALFGLGAGLGILSVRLAGIAIANRVTRRPQPCRVLLGVKLSRAHLAIGKLNAERGLKVVGVLHPEPIDAADRQAKSALGALPTYALRDIAQALEADTLTRLIIDRTLMSAIDLEILRRRARSLGVKVEDLQQAEGFAQSWPETESFLSRPETRFLDLPLETCYRGEVVLVTGAGGTIGSELCRQLLRLRPGKLVLLDHSEHALYQVDRSLRQLPEANAVQIVPALATVLDEVQLQDIMLSHGVTVVFHAAAYKHVPLVEQNGKQALANNVLGTENVVRCCKSLSIGRMILISSDKAVRPQSTMGLSKWMAEQVVHAAGATNDHFATGIVRFGNVLGSSGSVLPLFMEQVRRGGPVTVTHPEVERFFMTVDEAVQLVLQAGALVRDGEIFTLDMGAPVRIADLARQVIENTSSNERTQTAPVTIKYTGLKRGEKLREELSFGRTEVSSAHPKILTAPDEPQLSEIECAQLTREIRQMVATPGPLNEAFLTRMFSAAKRAPSAPSTQSGKTGLDSRTSILKRPLSA